MVYIALWFFFSALVGLYSKSKGGSVIAGFLMALIISPLLAFIILVFRKNIGVKKCPNCMEEIKKEASLCKHCGSQVTSIQ